MFRWVVVLALVSAALVLAWQWTPRASHGFREPFSRLRIEKSPLRILHVTDTQIHRMSDPCKHYAPPTPCATPSTVEFLDSVRDKSPPTWSCLRRQRVGRGKFAGETYPETAGQPHAERPHRAHHRQPRPEPDPVAAPNVRDLNACTPNVRQDLTLGDRCTSSTPSPTEPAAVAAPAKPNPGDGGDAYSYSRVHGRGGDGRTPTRVVALTQRFRGFGGGGGDVGGARSH